MKMTSGLLLLFLSGCLPLKQIEWHTSTNEIRISPEYSEIHVCVLTQTDDPAKKPMIDAARSYAVSPMGERLSLSVRMNSYAAKFKSPWTADYVRLYDPNNSNRRPKWQNGEWDLNLVFSDPSQRAPIYSVFKLWTFWYCPLIHGPPN